MLKSLNIENDDKNKIKKNINIKNRIKIKINIQKKKKKKKLNCFNIFDNYKNNSNLRSNIINKKVNTSDLSFKEDIGKKKIIKKLNNNNNNIIIKNHLNNVCKIINNNNNNSNILNKSLKEKSKIILSKDNYFQNHKYHHTSYNTTLSDNKGNINISNNIIINIKSNKNRNKSKTIKINEEKKDRKYYKSKTNELNNIIKNIDLFEYNNYINIDNINNSQIPKEYLNIIYYNLLKEEKEGIFPKPKYNYLNEQYEINEQMRSILIDWIIDVHYKFGFTDETLFMTVLIIDRYGSIKQISRTNLQLVGITSLMIACKHEEIDFPKVEDFIYITDNAYTKQEVFKMENDILCELNFSLLYPSPIKFFEYLSVNFHFSKKCHMMGKYLMESFLIDIKSIKYKASVISCACSYIVMKFFKMENYQESYNKKYYMLNESEDLPLGYGVKDCAQDICVLVDNIYDSNYLACFKKYSKNEFEKVALIIENK